MIKNIISCLMILMYSQILFAQVEDNKTSSWLSFKIFELPQQIKDFDQKTQANLTKLEEENKLLLNIIKEHHVFQSKAFNNIDNRLDSLQKEQEKTNQYVSDIRKQQDVQSKDINDIKNILTTTEFNDAIGTLEELQHTQDEGHKQESLKEIVKLLKKSALLEKTPFKLLMTYFIISECFMQYVPAEPKLAENYLIKIIGIPRPTDLQEKSIALLQYKINKNNEEAENDPLPIKQEVSLLNQKHVNLIDVLKKQKEYFADQEKIFLEYQEKVYNTLLEKYKNSTEVDANQKLERIEQMRYNSINNISEESPIIEEYIKIIKNQISNK